MDRFVVNDENGAPAGIDYRGLMEAAPTWTVGEPIIVKGEWSSERSSLWRIAGLWGTVGLGLGVLIGILIIAAAGLLGSGAQ